MEPTIKNDTLNSNIQKHQKMIQKYKKMETDISQNN